MKRDAIIVAILWAALTVVGGWLALSVNLLPVQGAEESAVIDEAFYLLLLLAVPVAALVLAMLIYSVVRFRSNDDSEEGPPLRNNRPIAWVWFLASTALAIFIVFNPGVKGIRELTANPNADLVVKIEGSQWHWKVSYPQYDLTYDQALQMALPVDTRVKFEITSRDVLHSVWIPAVRLKMDAVPGKVTEMIFTPTQVGDYESDPTWRVQCAELCGTGHARMQMAVRVLEPQEFEEWIAEAKEQVGMSEMAGMSNME